MTRSVSKISRTDGKVEPFSLLTNEDLHLFNEGNHFRLYEKMGVHQVEVNGVAGAYFSVWAPNAEQVHVVGDFNGWEKGKHPLHPKQESGIWEGFFFGVRKGDIYKYYIQSHHNEYRVEKADPFALFCERPPSTGSIVWDLDYSWKDQAWMGQGRKRHNFHNSPVSIYEVHLLIALDYVLVKDSKFVTDSISISRDPKTGDGVEKTSRKTPKSPIAQPCLDLAFLQFMNIMIKFRQSLFVFIINSKVDQVIGQ